MSNQDQFKGIPINHQDFILSYSDRPEDHGYDREQVEEILRTIQSTPLHPMFSDPNVCNDIGGFFEEGVCTDKNISHAIYWYERAIALGSDLARSNLADILRKGTGGTPIDLTRAFKLYSQCGIPYAHYRTGECYENGWGTAPDRKRARTYYTLAYKERHHLAIRKRQQWDFLNEE